MKTILSCIGTLTFALGCDNSANLADLTDIHPQESSASAPVDAGQATTDAGFTSLDAGLPPDAGCTANCGSDTFTPANVDGITSWHTSLALDRQGQPHVSYLDEGSRDLKYARRTGRAWHSETVDTQGSVGAFSSLALDSQDRPHISYFDSTSSNLKYAAWSGSAWVLETVDAANSVGIETSLALDASDRPHVAYLYFNYAKNSYGLKYAKKTTGAWQTDVVVAAFAAKPSLVVDKGGAPHLAFLENGTLKYAAWNGSAWSTQTVDSSVGQSLALALSPAGRPFIAYYGSGQRSVRLATVSGSTWSTQPVDTLINGDEEVGARVALALDPSGTLHLSYYELEQGSPATRFGNLKYARSAGNGFRAQYVERGEARNGFVRDSGRHASLAVDALGRAHVAYSNNSADRSLHGLRYARN